MIHRKTPEIANLQDLLIFQVKGISCYGKVLMENGAHMDKTVVSLYARTVPKLFMQIM